VINSRPFKKLCGRQSEQAELSALLALMAAGLSIVAAALSLLWFRRIA
jgi:hypothetical protein